jgi:hypothetical protein
MRRASFVQLFWFSEVLQTTTLGLTLSGIIDAS